MYKITSRWPHQSTIKVEWNLGKRCNYDCSYCPKEIHDNTSPHVEIEYVYATIDKLTAIGKPIRLSFTGGEPTVHPKFREIVEYAKHKGVTWINVTTNGTRTCDFYNNLSVDQLVFSIHVEHNWRKVLDTMLTVHNKSRNVIAQIMAHHQHMNSIREIYSTCKDNSVPATVRRIRWVTDNRDVFDDLRYAPTDLEWIKKKTATVESNCVIDDGILMHSNDVIKLSLNSFESWNCNAGVESLMINWDGEVYRATCRVGNSLGNIYLDTDFYFPDSGITCSRKWCTCASDIPITKIKKDE